MTAATPNQASTATVSPPPNRLEVWPAVSVGLPVVRLAQTGPLSLSLLSQHDRVLNLITPHGDLVAVVQDTVGPGPFNVIVTAWDRFIAAVTPDARGYLSETELTIGQQSITLRPASRYDPSPNWPAIAQSPVLATTLHHLQTWFGQQRLPRVAALDHHTTTALQRAISQVIAPATANERQQGLVRLLGLGPGLTPLGDDWLAGWLLRQRLAQSCDAPGANLPGYPPLDMITAFVTEHAASRTTRLSQAWLRAAAAGWVDLSWQRLLQRLANEPSDEIDRLAVQIVQHGATSGYAMLAGFLQEKLA